MVHFIYFNSLIFLLKQSAFWTSSNIWVVKTWNPLYLVPRFDIPLAIPHGGVFKHVLDLNWPLHELQGGWRQALVACQQALHLGELWEVTREQPPKRRGKVNGELASRWKLLVATTSGIVWVNKHLLWLADDIQSQPVIDYTECLYGEKSLCQTFVPIPIQNVWKHRSTSAEKRRELGRVDFCKGLWNCY